MEPKGQNTKTSDESQHEQGGASNPMGMCMGMRSEMLAVIHKTTSIAAFATPELPTLQLRNWGYQGV